MLRGCRRDIHVCSLTTGAYHVSPPPTASARCNTTPSFHPFRPPENRSNLDRPSMSDVSVDRDAGVENSMRRRRRPAAGGIVMGSLRVIELQLVAFIMVFSASGLVPSLDLVFPVLASSYLLLLSRLAFPAHRAARGESGEVVRGGAALRAYVVAGTIIGLFLPLAYVLGGFARGDEHAVRSATPHLFLLSFQILTENLVSGLSLFSPPVRAMVPLIYTVRRIFVTVDWIYDMWLNKALPPDAPTKEVAWLWFGKILAITNFLYFSINLFAFLIPCFLPRAFERYFKESGEVQAKMAEDKRSVESKKED